MSEKYLTTAEAIKRLNISRQTLYAWMKRNILVPIDMYPAVTIRRPQLMFREEDVRRLMPAETINEDDDVPPSHSNNKNPAA